jgi:ubiquinol-cytochrome c reductase cytochrome c1 subunit
MFRKIAISAVSALAVLGGAAWAEESPLVPDVAFSFEGPFGTFDKAQLKRGLQVYTEVCSACHGMKFVPIRSLGDQGGPQLSAEEVRDYAAALTITDPETGEDRAGKPADHFPKSNADIGAPDLSVMAKARAGFHGPYGLGINQLMQGMGGPEYIVSILTGFEDNPECAPDGVEGLYYNKAFAPGGYPDSCKIYQETKRTVKNDDGTTTERVDKVEIGRQVPGSWIKMPPPLQDDLVAFADGAPADLHSEAMDVTAFLAWTAEPKMEARKSSGFVAVVFLTLLAGLLFLTNRQLWAKVKGKADENA